MKTPCTKVLLILSSLTAAFLAVSVHFHCQITCGIYGDPTRFDIISEHIATVEKSMKQIEELSAAEDINYNQLMRWVNNKDEH